MGAVDERGAVQKAQRAMEGLLAKIHATMPLVAARLAEDAAGRAPSVDAEYNSLMAEDGGVADVPRAGDRSADSDGRIRLMKPESSYMKNAVMSDANVEITPMTVGFGNRAFLETQTVFSYQNLRRTGKNSFEPSDVYAVGPYFDALEEGGSETVVPVFSLANGHSYKLRPSDDPNNPGTDSMVKSFPGAFMFAQAALHMVAHNTITTALAELGPGRP